MLFVNLKNTFGYISKTWFIHYRVAFCCVILQLGPSAGPSAFTMWRHGETAEGNQQLLTLVHGVDRKGRPVIKAYTGNSRHPVYQEYQHVIDKHCQKAARLAASSSTIHSPHGTNSSCFDYYSESGSPSTPRTRVPTRLTSSSLSGASIPIIPDIRGMRSMISRLRCSLAIHSGLGETGKELNFLPLIPVGLGKQPTSDCQKRGRTKRQPTSTKQNFEGDLKKEHSSVTQPASLPSNNKGCCQGCKAWTCPKTKTKTKKRVKKNGKF